MRVRYKLTELGNTENNRFSAEVQVTGGDIRKQATSTVFGFCLTDIIFDVYINIRLLAPYEERLNSASI